MLKIASKKSIGHFIFLVAALCFPFLLVAQQQSPVIAFASDTQQPMLVEELFLKPDHNEKATAMIFKDIVSIHPAALFILGDIVALSYLDSKWAKMDTYLKSCADNHIPVYAALGNHEVMFNAAKGEQNFQKRFPMHSPTGYSQVVDSVAVILLNSNFNKMTAAAIAKQDNWYLNALKQMESDPAIKLIIVGCHHSPFTNSKVVNPSLQVQQKFVPAFLESKKCVLFVSGHSHNFERFKVKGKYFLVIGGGGGLHQPIYTGDREKTPDLSASYKPEFHYLEVRRHNDTLQITSRRLKGDFSGFNDGFKFNTGR
jgi:UDP-2,3-diacylglucosamine pyrophosphatase LpxH